MTATELRCISKRFGHLQAVDDVSLQLDNGCRVALLGPSGAGKTTLLRLLAGLEQPDSGELLESGVDITGAPPHQRRVALLSQDYALYPQLTVEQNLAASLASSGLAADARSQRITQVLQCFEVDELRSRLPASLSGGQAQRVALARCIVRRPQLLLLDEPFSQVDPHLRQASRGLILRTSAQFGISLLLVTHDPLDAMLLATHVAIMVQGKIQQFATIGEVYQRPNSRIAAELLSPFGLNWFRLAELHNSNHIELLADIPPESQWLGIRAEHLRCVPPEVRLPATGIRIRAEIQQLRCLGFANLAEATVDDLALCILDPGLELKLGPITLSVAEEHCIWLA